MTAVHWRICPTSIRSQNASGGWAGSLIPSRMSLHRPFVMSATAASSAMSQARLLAWPGRRSHLRERNWPDHLTWAIETAMRRAEIAVMRWEHLDRKARALLIPEAKIGRPGGCRSPRWRWRPWTRSPMTRGTASPARHDYRSAAGMGSSWPANRNIFAITGDLGRTAGNEPLGNSG